MRSRTIRAGHVKGATGRTAGRIRIAALVLVTLLAVAGCGSDDGDPATQADSPVDGAGMSSDGTGLSSETTGAALEMPDACGVVDEQRAHAVLNVIADTDAAPAFDPPSADYRYSESSESECIYNVGSAYLIVAVFADTPCEPNQNDTVPAHAISAPITAFASDSTSCGGLEGGSVYTLFGGSFSGESPATADAAWVEFYTGLLGT